MLAIFAKTHEMDSPYYQFTSIIQASGNNLWGFHFVVPVSVAQVFMDGDKRVVCTLNDGAAEYQCALLPKGDGILVIVVNKKICTRLRLKPGSSVQVSLRKDDSQYGLPMPEELAELLLQDEEGDRLFHALTPGKQRTLLYIIGNFKSSERRLHKAVIIIEHLKKNQGKINYRQLNEDFKA